MEEQTRKSFKFIPALLLAVVISHGGSVTGPFVWDDFFVITQNQALSELGNLPLFFQRSYWLEPQTGVVRPFRPIREAFFTIERAMFGLRPTGWHVTNLVLHATNAVLLLFLLRRLFGSFAVAAVSSLLFAVHPIHVEVVSWAKNSGELLAFLLAMAAILLYVSAVDKKGKRSVPLLPYLASLIFFLLALGCKESAAALPVLLALWATMLPRGRRAEALLWTVPFWLLSFVYAAAQVSLTSSGESSGFTIVAGHVNPIDRLWVSGKTIYLYLGMLSVPIHLTPLQIFPPTSRWLMTIGFIGGAMIAALGVFWLLRRRPEGFALIWCILAMGPVANLVAMNTGRPLAEQRMYLPSAGFCLLLAGLVVRASGAFRSRYRTAGVCILAGIMAAPLALMCARYTAVWSNRLSLWRHGVRHSPTLTTPRNQLANQYRDRGQRELEEAETSLAFGRINQQAGILIQHARTMREQGKNDEADAYFRAAAQFFRSQWQLLTRMGGIMRKRGKPQEAINCFENAIQGAPTYVPAHEGLALTLMELQKFEEAEKACLRGLKVAPSSAILHNVLGNVYARRGEFDEAQAEFEAAIEADAKFLDARCNLSLALAHAGQMQEAERELERTLQIAPESGVVYRAAAQVYEVAGQLEAAIEALQKALVINPDDADAKAMLKELETKHADGQPSR